MKFLIFIKLEYLRYLNVYEVIYECVSQFS